MVESQRERLNRLKADALEKTQKKQEASEKAVQTRKDKRTAFNKTFQGRFVKRFKQATDIARSRNWATALARASYGKKIIPKPRTKLARLPSGKYAYVPVYSKYTGGNTVSGMSSGGRGRPTRTYNKLYAPYGGVYGYRKMLNAKLRQEKLAALQQATISPQQQVYLNQLAAKKRYDSMNEESKIIPNTHGGVYLDGIMDEINRASGLVD